MGAGRLILGSVAALALALSLAGCNSNDVNRTAFDGVYFKTKAKKLGDDLADFTVQIPGVSRSLEGARGAGEYEGTRYCIKNFGTSDITWVVGPETDPARLVIEKDTLTFQGRCRS